MIIAQIAGKIGGAIGINYRVRRVRVIKNHIRAKLVGARRVKKTEVEERLLGIGVRFAIGGEPGAERVLTPPDVEVRRGHCVRQAHRLLEGVF